MARRLPADMPVLPLDGHLVACWAVASLVGGAMWVAIGFGVCTLTGWC